MRLEVWDFDFWYGCKVSILLWEGLALLQRALRILKTEKKLWIHYFRLELLYRKKLADRLSIMGVDQIALAIEKKEEGKSIELEDAVIAQDEDLDSMDRQTDKIACKASNPFFEGKIASIIFRTACNNFPDDLDFVLEFWNIYRQFGNTENLQEEVYEYIRSSITLTSNARGFLARIPLLSCTSVEHSTEFVDNYQKCVELFNSHIEELCDSTMFNEYISFFQQLLSRSIDAQCVSYIIHIHI